MIKNHGLFLFFRSLFLIFRYFSLSLQISHVRFYLMEKFNSSEPIRVLVADDSNAIRTLLSHALEKLGYEVTLCKNGNEAWKHLKSGTFYHITLIDWVMPGLSGIELCRRIRSMKSDNYRYIILLTGNDTTNEIIEGLESGADDYLIKPVSIGQLKARIDVGIRLNSYEQALRNKENDVRLTCYKTLTELAEARDYETGAHLSRIAGLSKLLATEAGCSPSFCREVEIFSPMHDIGKVGIPDGILHLPRKLSANEFEIIKSHAEIGYQILKDKETFETAAEIAWTHHEKWNGTGYPRGIKGEAIPLSGRVVAVVDVYDALRSARPYKTPFSHAESVDWIIKAAGKAFDPDLIKAFKRCEEGLRTIFDEQYDEKFEALLAEHHGYDSDEFQPN